MGAKQYIVVEDPENSYWEGALVDEQRAGQLRARGVALLPCLPDMFRRSGVGGYARRAWGAGWPLDSAVPRMVAPLTVYLAPEAGTHVYWLARLVCDQELLEKYVDGSTTFDGSLRFACDTGQHNPHRVGLAATTEAIDVRRLGKPDVRGGWTVGGAAKASIPQSAHYGFAAYGMAPGLRLAWLAASLAGE